MKRFSVAAKQSSFWRSYVKNRLTMVRCNAEASLHRIKDLNVGCRLDAGPVEMEGVHHMNFLVANAELAGRQGILVPAQF